MILRNFVMKPRKNESQQPTDWGNDHPEELRLAFEQGSVLALLDAIDYCREFNLIVPQWVLQGSYELIIEALTGTGPKRTGPGGNRLAEATNNLKVLISWATVDDIRRAQKSHKKELKLLKNLKETDRDVPREAWIRNRLKQIGTTVDDAHRVASKMLRGTLSQGSAKSIRKRDNAIRRAMKRGEFPGRYHLPRTHILNDLGIGEFMKLESIGEYERKLNRPD